ncbi:protein Mpv17-like [Pistacia vera]|uniref:protein Mpv17-like n=1 Tax=Pistacia vera TaxID=55513 RepID=UPI0012632CF5|nr:protein Mpv17-like [Pistacia vera]
MNGNKAREGKKNIDCNFDLKMSTRVVAAESWLELLRRKAKPRNSGSRNSKSSDSVEATGRAGYRFPLKQAVTAGSLALTVTPSLSSLTAEKDNALKQHPLHSDKNDLWAILLDHDWIRALRMTSYGFLLYGPGSYAWYQLLERCMPKQTVENLLLKVLLNQIVLGPCVIAVVFAWNNLWLRKVSELPNKYKKDALPTLLYGFRFWIPVSILNFWVVPLQARVAFMSMGSIFWNFYLSSTMSK